jgi:hypothetical protein
MNTVRLKASHLRGTTAVKVCNLIMQEVEKVMIQFYREHIPNIIIQDNDYSLLPMVRLFNQSDLVSFLQPWRDAHHSCGYIYSSSPVESFLHPKGKDFILLFDDTLRIDIKWDTEKYEYKYIPYASSWTGVEVSMICLDRQKLLDALHIEPDTKIPAYVDIVGNPIHIGDVVCITTRDTTRLFLDKVKNLTPYSIVLENGRSISYKAEYDNKIVVISDLQSNLLKK